MFWKNMPCTSGTDRQHFFFHYIQYIFKMFTVDFCFDINIVRVVSKIGAKDAANLFLIRWRVKSAWIAQYLFTACILSQNSFKSHFNSSWLLIEFFFALLPSTLLESVWRATRMIKYSRSYVSRTMSFVCVLSMEQSWRYAISSTGEHPLASSGAWVRFNARIRARKCQLARIGVIINYIRRATSDESMKARCRCCTLNINTYQSYRLLSNAHAHIHSKWR